MSRAARILKNVPRQARGMTTDATSMAKRTEFIELLEERRDKKVLMEFMSEFGSTQTRDSAYQPHLSLHRPVPVHELTLSALMAAGAHMGHNEKVLRPAFLPYAYGKRAGITIIDLEQTLPHLRRAANVVKAVARDNGSILFLGTKPELRPALVKAVQRMGRNAYHITGRWKPGLLTNSRVVNGDQLLASEKDVPDLVVILNPLDNVPAIRECAVRHIPTIGIIDSNVDPRLVMYPIPANDDSVRTAELIVGMLSMSGRQGIELLEEREAHEALLEEARRTAELLESQENEEESELLLTEDADEAAEDVGLFSEVKAKGNKVEEKPRGKPSKR